MIAGAEATESLLPVITHTNPANPADDIARNLTGRDYVSRSVISTFRTCPLRYEFRYVDGLPEESVSSALVFGTGIHTAVKQHYQALLAGDAQPDVERLMFASRNAWLPHEPDQIQFGTNETRETLDDPASRMLTAFPASDQARVSGRVLGVEEEIRNMLVEGVPDLYGHVDLLTEDASHVRDWLADRRRRLAAQGRLLAADDWLVQIPSGLIRIPDRDLAAAGIPKVDERGRRLDVTKAVNSLPAPSPTRRSRQSPVFST